MNIQPMLACGGGGILFLLVFAPVVNCVIAFVGGAICTSMGNKAVGGWTMFISAVFGFVFFELTHLA
jgi:hypothetical protein